MTIKEYWARLVAAGLIPNKWKDVKAILKRAQCYEMYKYVILSKYGDLTTNIEVKIPDHIQEEIDMNEEIQLRKDGVDSVELEWVKPTENDIGKMGWIIADHGVLMSITMTEISKKGKVTTYNDNGWPWSTYYVLVASHGQIAPTPENFKKVYGE
jgi:hypothetical protein